MSNKPLDLQNGISTTVFLTLKLDPNSNFFTEKTLKVSLYKYNPMIADVSATLVDKKIFKVDYKKGNEPFSVETILGKSGQFRKNHKYYITADITNNEGKRTHYGYKNGTDGFTKVLESSRDVLMILKPIQ